MLWRSDAAQAFERGTCKRVLSAVLDKGRANEPVTPDASAFVNGRTADDSDAIFDLDDDTGFGFDNRDPLEHRFLTRVRLKVFRYRTQLTVRKKISETTTETRPPPLGMTSRRAGDRHKLLQAHFNLGPLVVSRHIFSERSSRYDTVAPMQFGVTPWSGSGP